MKSFIICIFSKTLLWLAERASNEKSADFVFDKKT